MLIKGTTIIYDYKGGLLFAQLYWLTAPQI